MAGRGAVEGVGMSAFWRGRRVLVTGATGLVGSWLTKRLLELGAEVTAFILEDDSRSELARSGALREVRVAHGALEDIAALERTIGVQGTEVVFHLGAQAEVPKALRSPLATFEANIRGTYHVLEACREHRDVVERIVYASSDKVYGDREKLCREEMALEPRHPYEVSKLCGEQLMRSYYATYGLRLGIARCGNIYGGGDLHWDRIVPGTVRSLWRRQPPVIRSNGRLVRDYFYVADAAQAYLTLAEQLDRDEVCGQAFNFSAEIPLTVLEIVEQIQRLMGASPVEPIILNQAVGEITIQMLSAEKARGVLGWTPQWTLEAGLAETIAWYRAFFEGQEDRMAVQKAAPT